MPGTTANGYRYPLDTDPVADGGQAVRNLAQDVDDFGGKMRSGVVTIHMDSGDNTASETVTFPDDYFGAAPHVVVTGTGPSFRTRIGAVTADDVVVVLIRVDPSADADIDVHWIAHRN